MAFTASGFRKVSDSGLISSQTLSGSIWVFADGRCRSAVSALKFFSCGTFDDRSHLQFRRRSSTKWSAREATHAASGA